MSDVHSLTGSHRIHYVMQMHHTSPEYDANGQECTAVSAYYFIFEVMYLCKVRHIFKVIHPCTHACTEQFYVCFGRYRLRLLLIWENIILGPSKILKAKI